MKHVFLTLLLVFACFPAQANLTVSPFYISFNADSPKRSAEVFITNTTKEAKTYRINIEDYAQKRDGSFNAQKTGNSAVPYFAYSPRQTTLQPGETQTLRIQRKPMGNAPDGQYVSRLKIAEVLTPSAVKSVVKSDGTMSMEVKALFAVTLPVLVDKGTLSANGKIASVKAEGKKLKITVSRSGAKALYASLSVQKGGKEIGRLNNIWIFPPLLNRDVTVPLTQTGGDIDVILLDAQTNEKISSRSTHL